eukprot:jgi/Botrbrau1/6009/Bobra.104_1s0036.1
MSKRTSLGDVMEAITSTVGRRFYPTKGPCLCCNWQERTNYARLRVIARFHTHAILGGTHARCIEFYNRRSGVNSRVVRRLRFVDTLESLKSPHRSSDIKVTQLISNFLWGCTYGDFTPSLVLVTPSKVNSLALVLPFVFCQVL